MAIHPLTDVLPGTLPLDTSAVSGSATELVALATAIPTTAVVTVAGTAPAGGAGATAGAYDTAAHRDALIATVAEITTQFNALLAVLRTAGIVTP
jgi:hypothetical protein